MSRSAFPLRSNNSSRGLTKNSAVLKKDAGLYCTAEPGSEEWKSYQSVRLKSIKNLKFEKDSAKIVAQIRRMNNNNETNSLNTSSSTVDSKKATTNSGSTTSGIHTILKKKKGFKADGRTSSCGSVRPESVRWKIPLDEFNVNNMKDSKLITPNVSLSNAKRSTERLLKPKKVGAASVKGPPSMDLMSKESLRPVTLGSSSFLYGNASTNLVPEPNAPVRPAQRKPPVFPNLEVCNVFPGTPEWDTYWNKFNSSIKKYYKEMDEYGKDIDFLSKDLKLYREHIQQITFQDQAFQIHLGMLPFEKKAPILKELVLGDSIRMIGGWMIKTVGGVESVEGIRTVTFPKMYLTSFDHASFRLEIHLRRDDRLDDIESRIKVNTVNLMLIYLGDDVEVHIGAPVGKSNIEDELNIGLPLNNGGKLIINSKGA